MEHHGGDIADLLSGPPEQLRRDLLARRGIGPETADAILLYAGNIPSFVIDRYTLRVFSRLGILAGNETYGTVRTLFMAQLPPDPDLFNEYHALIVQHAKSFCRKTPLCSDCPLLSLCPFGRANIA
jgi:endonuclease-3 related protein